MAQAGGCVCDGIRYTIEGEPVAKALCHCKDCRKISGSTYSTNGVYPSSGFKVTKGEAKTHSTKGDSGNTITSYFCPDCGSTMWRDGGAFPGMVIVKLGTLDDPKALENLKPVRELYASGRVSWVSALEGAEQKDKM
ncbi:unnamed protein product [Periconia digitata]|uniref:CENP-V/GFA domain-containing protein n=1 Tax=Periconia digitata TaxID=1303443 RepID=A0A9W4XRN7_9PLEO|nr:unnamed protein product [Periconia digitata]